MRRHLGMSEWIYLVDGVPRRAARLTVQVVGLHEDRVVALTPDPDITLGRVRRRMRGEGVRRRMRGEGMMRMMRG